MSTFKFNDHFCLSARQLKKEADTHGFSTEEWYGRANSFMMRRGVEPAEGWLLVHQFDAAATNNLQITYRNVSDGNVTTEIGTKTFHHLKVKTARKITPAASREKGYYLVHVVDERYALEEAYVGKRFNLVTGFQEAQSPGQFGTFEYHQETIKEGNPYTWKELFEEVWEVPSEQTLDFSDIVTLDYPKHLPQDVDFRYVTRKTALMMLCQWCNFTILVTNSGTYKVARINDTGDQLTNLLKTYEDARLKSKDRYVDLGDPGYPEPKKYELYFKKLSPTAGIKEYETLFRNANNSAKASEREEPFHIPLTETGGSSVAPDYQLGNAADAFVMRQKPFLGMFPPQEKTYHGFLNLDCKAYLDEVTWYNLTGRGYTRIKSVCWPDWKIRPTDPDDLSGNPVSIAVGKVVGVQSGIQFRNVESSDLLFYVNQLRKISGPLPDGVQEGSAAAVIVRNTFKLSYVIGKEILIFTNLSNDPIWDTDALGAGGNPIIRFELAEDKEAEDTRRLAWAIGDDDVRFTTEPEIYVDDMHEKWHGWGPRTDDLYGLQTGYTGYATRVYELSAQGRELDGTQLSEEFPVYQILHMEHSARYVEGYIPDNESAAAEKIVIPTDYWDGREPRTETIEINTDTSYVGIVYEDRQQLFEPPGPNDKVKLVWDEKEEKYILWVVKILNDVSAPAVALIRGTIPAATILETDDEVLPGVVAASPLVKAGALILKWSDDGTKFVKDADKGNDGYVDAYNLSLTDFVGSVTTPIAVLGSYFVEELPEAGLVEGFIVIDKDFRSMPGYDKTKNQIPRHKANEEFFRLGGENCNG